MLRPAVTLCCEKAIVLIALKGGTITSSSPSPRFSNGAIVRLKPSVCCASTLSSPACHLSRVPSWKATVYRPAPSSPTIQVSPAFLVGRVPMVLLNTTLLSRSDESSIDQCVAPAGGSMMTKRMAPKLGRKLHRNSVGVFAAGPAAGPATCASRPRQAASARIRGRW